MQAFFNKIIFLNTVVVNMKLDSHDANIQFINCPTSCKFSVTFGWVILVL